MVSVVMESVLMAVAPVTESELSGVVWPTRPSSRALPDSDRACPPSTVPWNQARPLLLIVEVVVEHDRPGEGVCAVV